MERSGIRKTLEELKKTQGTRDLADFTSPMDHTLMSAYLELFAERYAGIRFGSIGQSILGRSIPLITLGHGEKAVLYVGTHHGMEWMTTILLLRFINEYAELAQHGRRIFNVSVPLLEEARTIYIIPMLNPDGVDYSLHGVAENNPLRERLLSMNGGSEDFSRWQANARGVDLNHNYDAGFEEYQALQDAAGIVNGAPTRYSGTAPESEPEVAALCGFLRSVDNIRAVLTLHTQGEEIYYGSGVTAPKSVQIAKTLSRICGYRLGSAEGMAAYGGMTDWYVREFERPAFTLECGSGENPLPIGQFFRIYTDLRELFFEMPFLV